MTSASNGTITVSYEYDGLGRRVKRTKGTDITKYTYDGLDVIQDDNGADGVTRYQNGLGIDDKLRIESECGVQYFVKDHLGSTNALADSAGVISSSTTYDSYGNATADIATRYRYTGRELDSDTGLYYYRNRWYDPEIGKFISEDPIGT